jgi:SAM-dependent methyltransferase
VRIVRGDVMRVPLATQTMDAVISQEALLHVPDKRAALSEAHRVLKHGGRLAFTDWAEHRRLDTADSESMWRGIAAQSVQSFVSYPRMLREIGFRNVTIEDLTADWGRILEERFAMYRNLREETARLGMPTGDEEFYRSYARLVALVQERTLGGGRFAAQKRARPAGPTMSNSSGHGPYNSTRKICREALCVCAPSSGTDASKPQSSLHQVSFRSRRSTPRCAKPGRTICTH